jgi:hypothetical protein
MPCRSWMANSRCMAWRPSSCRRFHHAPVMTVNKMAPRVEVSMKFGTVGDRGDDFQIAPALVRERVYLPRPSSLLLARRRVRNGPRRAPRPNNEKRARRRSAVPINPRSLGQKAVHRDHTAFAQNAVEKPSTRDALLQLWSAVDRNYALSATGKVFLNPESRNQTRAMADQSALPRPCASAVMNRS